MLAGRLCAVTAEFFRRANAANLNSGVSLTSCIGTIFSENRLPLFGIMRWACGAAGIKGTVPGKVTGFGGI
jgi:hypothetical protein